MGLCLSQARFAALYAALGFPEHKILANAAGVTVDVVSSRLYRLRRRFRCNRLQFVTLIDRAVRGAGDPALVFSHSDRGVRGTNKEEER